MSMVVDELATHYSVDELYVDSVIVSAIGADKITYRVAGSVEVTLQWGSNSDLRRGTERNQVSLFRSSVNLSYPWTICGVLTSQNCPMV